jgi:uncharacterized protein YegP (UPF0339 family)
MLCRNAGLVLSVLLACPATGALATPSPGPLLAQTRASQKAAKASGRALKFETYSDAKGESRWRLKASNGQVIATSGQGYKDKRDCKNAIERIKKDARTLKFETYADTRGESRWRLKASNGQVIATSGQGYKDKRDCENAIDVIKEGAATAKVEESKSAEGS